MPKHANITEQDDFKFNRIPTLRSFYSRDGSPPVYRSQQQQQQQQPPPPPPPPPLQPPAGPSPVDWPPPLPRPRPACMRPRPLGMTDKARRQHFQDMGHFLNQIYMQQQYCYEPTYFIIPSETRQQPLATYYNQYINSIPIQKPVIHREYRLPRILECNIKNELLGTVDENNNFSEELSVQSNVNYFSGRFGYFTSQLKRVQRIKKKKTNINQEKELMKNNRKRKSIGRRKKMLSSKKISKSKTSSRYHECGVDSKTTIDESLEMDSEVKLLSDPSSKSSTSKGTSKKFQKFRSSTERESSFNKDQGGKVIFINTDFSSQSKGDSSKNCSKPTFKMKKNPYIRKEKARLSDSQDSAFCSRNKIAPSSNTTGERMAFKQKGYAAGKSIKQQEKKKQPSSTPLYKLEASECALQNIVDLVVLPEERDLSERCQERDNEPKSSLSVVQFSYAMPASSCDDDSDVTFIPTIQSEPNMVVIPSTEIRNYQNTDKITLEVCGRVCAEERCSDIQREKSREHQCNENSEVSEINKSSQQTHDCTGSLNREVVGMVNAFHCDTVSSKNSISLEDKTFPHAGTMSCAFSLKTLVDDFTELLDKEDKHIEDATRYSKAEAKNELKIHEAYRNVISNLDINEDGLPSSKYAVTNDITNRSMLESESTSSQPLREEKIALPKQNQACPQTCKEHFVEINNRNFRVSEDNIYQEVVSNSSNTAMGRGSILNKKYFCDDPPVQKKKLKLNEIDIECEKFDYFGDAAYTGGPRPSPSPSVVPRKTNTILKRCPQVLGFQSDPCWENANERKIENKGEQMANIPLRLSSSGLVKSRSKSEPAEEVVASRSCEPNYQPVNCFFEKRSRFLLRYVARRRSDELSTSARGKVDSTLSVPIEPKKSCPEQNLAHMSTMVRISDNTVQQKRPFSYRGAKLLFRKYEKGKNDKMHNIVDVGNAKRRISLDRWKTRTLRTENNTVSIKDEIYALPHPEPNQQTKIIDERKFQYGESTILYPIVCSKARTNSLTRGCETLGVKRELLNTGHTKDHFFSDYEKASDTKGASQGSLCTDTITIPPIHVLGGPATSSTQSSDSCFEISSRILSISQISARSITQMCDNRTQINKQSSHEADNSLSTHFTKGDTPTAKISTSSTNLQKGSSTEPGIMIWEFCDNRLKRHNELTMVLTASAEKMFLERHSFVDITDGNASNALNFQKDNSILMSLNEEKSHDALKDVRKHKRSYKLKKKECVSCLVQKVENQCVDMDQLGPSRFSPLQNRSIVASEGNTGSVCQSNIPKYLAYIASNTHLRDSDTTKMNRGDTNAKEGQQTSNTQLKVNREPQTNTDNDYTSFKPSEMASEQKDFKNNKTNIPEINESDSNYVICTSQVTCEEKDNIVSKLKEDNLRYIYSSFNTLQERLENGIPGTKDNSKMSIQDNTIHQLNSKSSNRKQNICVDPQSSCSPSTENLTSTLPFTGPVLFCEINSSTNGNSTSQDLKLPASSKVSQEKSSPTNSAHSSTSLPNIGRYQNTCLVISKSHHKTDFSEFRLSGGSCDNQEIKQIHRSGDWNICPLRSCRVHAQLSSIHQDHERIASPQSFRHLPRTYPLFDKENSLCRCSENENPPDIISRRRRGPDSHSRETHSLQESISAARRLCRRPHSASSTNASSRAQSSHSGSPFESIPEYPLSRSNSSSSSSSSRSRSSEEPVRRRKNGPRKRHRSSPGLISTAKKCFSTILKQIPSVTNKVILRESNEPSQESIPPRKPSGAERADIQTLYAQTYGSYKLFEKIPKLSSPRVSLVSLKNVASCPLGKGLIRSGGTRSEMSSSSNVASSTVSAILLSEMKQCIDRLAVQCIDIENNYEAVNQHSDQNVCSSTHREEYNTLCQDSLPTPQEAIMQSIPWSLLRPSSSPNPRTLLTSKLNFAVPEDKLLHAEKKIMYKNAIQRTLNEVLQNRINPKRNITSRVQKNSQGTQAEGGKPHQCEVGIGTELNVYYNYCEIMTQTVDSEYEDKSIQVNAEQELGVLFPTVDFNQFCKSVKYSCDSSGQWDFSEYNEKETPQRHAELRITPNTQETASQCSASHLQLVTQSSQTEYKIHEIKTVRSDLLEIFETSVQLDECQLISKGVQVNVMQELSGRELHRKDSFSQTDDGMQNAADKQNQPVSARGSSDVGHGNPETGRQMMSRGYNFGYQAKDEKNPSQRQGTNQYGNDERDGRQRLTKCKKCEGVNPPCEHLDTPCPASSDALEQRSGNGGPRDSRRISAMPRDAHGYGPSASDSRGFGARSVDSREGDPRAGDPSGYRPPQREPRDYGTYPGYGPPGYGPQPDVWWGDDRGRRGGPGRPGFPEEISRDPSKAGAREGRYPTTGDGRPAYGPRGAGAPPGRYPHDGAPPHGPARPGPPVSGPGRGARPGEEPRGDTSADEREIQVLSPPSSSDPSRPPTSRQYDDVPKNGRKRGRRPGFWQRVRSKLCPPKRTKRGSDADRYPKNYSRDSRRPSSVYDRHSSSQYEKPTFADSTYSRTPGDQHEIQPDSRSSGKRRSTIGFRDEEEKKKKKERLYEDSFDRPASRSQTGKPDKSSSKPIGQTSQKKDSKSRHSGGRSDRRSDSEYARQSYDSYGRPSYPYASDDREPSDGQYGGAQGRPPHSPYGQQSGYPYGQQPGYPYGQQPGDPYGQQYGPYGGNEPHGPYGQPSYSDDRPPSKKKKKKKPSKCKKSPAKSKAKQPPPPDSPHDRYRPPPHSGLDSGSGPESPPRGQEQACPPDCDSVGEQGRSPGRSLDPPVDGRMLMCNMEPPQGNRDWIYCEDLQEQNR